MTYSRTDLKKLISLVDVTAEEEIDCDQFLHRVAGYLEGLGPGGVAPPGYEDVVQHLQICPEGLEEVAAAYRALCDEGELPENETVKE